MANERFIRNEDGLYLVPEPVQREDILDQAAEILFEDLSNCQSMTNPTVAGRFLQAKLAGEPNEQFVALFLDNRHRLRAFEELFSGTINGAAVYPRVVVMKALKHNAAAVIFAHNHPSGDPEPSEADRRLTRRLQDALGLIDIRVLDHLVVTGSDLVSMAERGWL